MEFIVLSGYAFSYFLISMVISSILRKTFAKWSPLACSEWLYKAIFILSFVPSLLMFAYGIISVKTEHIEWGSPIEPWRWGMIELFLLFTLILTFTTHLALWFAIPKNVDNRFLHWKKKIILPTAFLFPIAIESIFHIIVFQAD